MSFATSPKTRTGLRLTGGSMSMVLLYHKEKETDVIIVTDEVLR